MFTGILGGLFHTFFGILDVHGDFWMFFFDYIHMILYFYLLDFIRCSRGVLVNCLTLNSFWWCVWEWGILRGIPWRFPSSKGQTIGSRDLAMLRQNHDVSDDAFVQVLVAYPRIRYVFLFCKVKVPSTRKKQMHQSFTGTTKRTWTKESLLSIC